MKKPGISTALLLGFLCSIWLSCPGRAESYTEAGNTALEELRYEEACQEFEEAVKNGENKAAAYRGAGMAYMGMADYTTAAQAFQAALEYAQEDGKMKETEQDIRLYLASCYYRMESYEAVIDDTAAILEEDDSCMEAYFWRGAARVKLELLTEAAEDFDQAVALAPTDYSLYLNIYECYEQEDLSGVGNSYLETALDIHAEGTEQACQRGKIYYFLGDYEKAKEELAEAAEEKNEKAMYLIGQVYLALEDYTHAKNMYAQIEESFGSSAKCSAGMAQCLLEEGQIEDAISELEQGIAIGTEPDLQELYRIEIIAYEQKQDYAAALDKARTYVSRYPTDKEGQKELTFLQTRVN